MRLYEILYSTFLLSTLTRADIEFIFPIAGSTAKGGEVLTALWKDSGYYPKVSELTNYTLSLCAGRASTTSTIELAVLIENGIFARGNSVSFRIDPDIGPNGENEYFLKMVSQGPGSSAVNYSNRFTLAQMTGSFPDSIQKDAKPNSTSESLEYLERRQWKETSDLFETPYPDQLGLTKYAPMAKEPASTIPAGTPAPQFPVSNYVMATTYLAEPTVQTTITASQTFSVSSIENTASPAANPQEDMNKYLKRWRD